MIADVRMAWRRREQYLEAKRAEKTEEQRRIEQKKRRLTEIRLETDFFFHLC